MLDLDSFSKMQILGAFFIPKKNENCFLSICLLLSKLLRVTLL